MEQIPAHRPPLDPLFRQPSAVLDEDLQGSDGQRDVAEVHPEPRDVREDRPDSGCESL